MTESLNDPFLAWLETGTTVRETVTMFLDRGARREAEPLWKELDALEASLEEIENGQEHGQRALGDKSQRSKVMAEIEALNERLEPLEQRLAASKAVWQIRPLIDDEIDEIDAALPMPKMPLPTEEQKTSEKAKKRWQGLYDQYVEDAATVRVDRDLTYLAKAIVSLETAARTVDTVSVDYLRALKKKPLGSQYINMLTEAFNKVMTLEKEPTRPFSSSSSDSVPE